MTFFSIQIDSVAEEVERCKGKSDMVRPRYSFSLLSDKISHYYVLTYNSLLLPTLIRSFRCSYMEGLGHCIQMLLYLELRKHLESERFVMTHEEILFYTLYIYTYTYILFWLCFLFRLLVRCYYTKSRLNIIIQQFFDPFWAIFYILFYKERTS